MEDTPAARAAERTRPGPVHALFRPVDVSSLAFFRVAFGLVMLWECDRYWVRGWIKEYWVEPAWNFPYAFFEWVTPWQGKLDYWLGDLYWMEVHFVVLAALSVMVALGLFYRVSAFLLFLAFTYIFLLEEARYLNHFYLVSLVSFVMIFVPCHRSFSLDAWLFRRRRSETVPFWSVFLLRFMVGLPYFFGGIAKINSDWLHGEPMRMWLSEKADHFLPWIPEAFFAANSVVYSFVYGGLLLDLLAVPFLCWSRTRPFCMLFILLFHFTNSRLFGIGIFPWFMIVATTIYFPVDWPRRVGRDLWRSPTWLGSFVILTAMATGYVAIAVKERLLLLPFLGSAVTGGLIFWTLADRFRNRTRLQTALFTPTELPAGGAAPSHLGSAQRVTAGLLALWMAIHIALPLRHYLIEGDVNWTEEGHRFSWHMKLRDKASRARFFAFDPATGERWRIRRSDYLTNRQFRKMSKRPYMIRQFAHHVADKLREEGYPEIEITAEVRVSLNGREYQFLIDPTVNLAAEKASFWKADWIVPLEKPLPGYSE